MATPTLDDASGCGFAFQDGDVIIRTSKHPSGIFVVHKDVLSAQSPVLAVIISAKWSNFRSVPTTKSSKAIEIYELDLYFDRETKLCLLTGTKDSLTRESPEIPLEKAICDLPSGLDATPEEQSAYREYITNSLARRPRPRFLWSEPQPSKCTTFSQDDGMYYVDRTEYTYDGYLTSYEAFIPPLQSGRGSLLRRQGYGPSNSIGHRHVLAFGRAIWRALITLMYGQRLVIRVHRYEWRRELEFIAALFVHPDYLNMSVQVTQMLGEALRNVPELWAKVTTEPELFFHLAYRLWQPEIYLDEAKHLIGPRIHNDQAGHIDHYTFSQGGSRVEAKYYRYEMMTLLLAATNELHSMLAKLKGDLVQSSGLLLQLPIAHFLLPEEQVGYKRQGRAEEALSPYVIEAKRILNKYVVSLVQSNELPRGWTSNPSPNTAMEAKLFQLRRVCRILHPKEIESLLLLSRTSYAKTFDYDKLLRCLKTGLDRLVTSLSYFEPCLLLQRHHTPECAVGAEDENEVGGRYAENACARCCRSRHDVGTHFTWHNHEGLLLGRDDRPWPLDADLRPLTMDFVTNTVPASYEYLDLIGLNNEFSYLSMKLEHRIDGDLLQEDTLGERLARMQKTFKEAELLVDVPVSAAHRLLSYKTSREPHLAFYRVPLLAFLKPQRNKMRDARRAMKQIPRHDDKL